MEEISYLFSNLNVGKNTNNGEAEQSNHIDTIGQPNESVNDIVEQFSSFTTRDYNYLSDTSIEDSIHRIKNTHDFTDDFLAEMISNPHWDILKYHYAERVGYLGDKFLMEDIDRLYIKTLDEDIITSLFIGGSIGGHVHVMQHALQYESTNINLEREDIICNIFQSDVDEAVDYLLNFTKNVSTTLFIIKQSNKIQLLTHKKFAVNVFKNGTQEDKDFMMVYSDEDTVLYAMGASGNMDAIRQVSFTECDIKTPLYGALAYGEMNVVKYYFEELGIGPVLPQYELLSIVLENRQFVPLDYMIVNGLDLEPILFHKVGGFDYVTLLPVLEEYMSACDYPQ